MRTAAILALLFLAAGTAWAATASNPPGCTDFGDRLTKLTLIERLAASPQVLILGSSRARVAMPATVRQLTGRSAFNAGVRGGVASDEYVFTRLLAQRFPGQKRAYVIFVDVGIANDGVNPELADEPLARSFLGDRASTSTTTCRVTSTYLPDGSIAGTPVSAAVRARKRAASIPPVLRSITARTEKFRRIDPARTTFFQRLLAFVNAQGATPVIVINPVYPSVLAKRRRYGFPERRAAGVYLDWLRRRYRFVLVDAEDIRTWGGKASDFINVDHIDRANMARLLRYVVAHSHGVLTRR